ncbi:ricin-type beta-trefoil lectin domain protein [Streptomyces sp. NPDC055709]
MRNRQGTSLISCFLSYLVTGAIIASGVMLGTARSAAAVTPGNCVVNIDFANYVCYGSPSDALRAATGNTLSSAVYGASGAQLATNATIRNEINTKAPNNPRILGVAYSDWQWSGNVLIITGSSGACQPDVHSQAVTLPTDWLDQLSSYTTFSNCYMDFSDGSGNYLTGPNDIMPDPSVYNGMGYVSDSSNDRARWVAVTGGPSDAALEKYCSTNNADGCSVNLGTKTDVPAAAPTPYQWDQFINPIGFSSPLPDGVAVVDKLANCNAPTATLMSTRSATVNYTYTIGLSASVGVDVLDIFKASFDASFSYAWGKAVTSSSTVTATVPAGKVGYVYWSADTQRVSGSVTVDFRSPRGNDYHSKWRRNISFTQPYSPSTGRPGQWNVYVTDMSAADQAACPATAPATPVSIVAKSPLPQPISTYVRPTTTGRPGQIKNVSNGLCLDVPAGNIYDGAPVTQYGCSSPGVSAPVWTIGRDGAIRVGDPNNNKCLDVTQSGTANGTKLQIWRCNGTGAQQWQWRNAPDGPLFNPQSGRCMDNPGQTTVVGIQQQIYDCNGQNAQRFKLADNMVLGSGGTMAGSSQGLIRSGITGKCLATHLNQAFQRNMAESATCHNSAEGQQWYLGADGSVRAQGYCLDVPGGGATIGLGLQIYDCNASPAQRWQYRPYNGGGGDLYNPNSGKCAVIPGGSTADGTQLQLGACDGGMSGRWQPLGATPISGPQPTTNPPNATGNKMLAGQRLDSGQSISSSSATLTMQSDGKLVVSAKVGSRLVQLWSAETSGHPGAYALMQSDGNLVIYKSDGGFLWNSATSSNPGAYAVIQDDGNLVVYKQGGGPTVAGSALWATGTNKVSATLTAGQRWNPGDWVDGDATKLIMQPDGNLVMYKESDGSVVWASTTQNNPGAYATMLADGKLVIYKAGGGPSVAGSVLWDTGTNGNFGAYAAADPFTGITPRLYVLSPAGQSPNPMTDRLLWDSQRGLATSSTPPPPSAPPAASGDKILAGQRLYSGTSIVSPSTKVTMQSDGNLVVLARVGPVSVRLWSSGTSGHPGAYADMQSDGNLVIYKSDGGFLWNSATSSNPGAYAVIQDDGNLVVYKQGGGPTVAGSALWATGTNKVSATLTAGQRWNPGDWTDTSTAKLIMQPDGNLVLYRKADGGTLWDSNTSNNPDAYATMQADGNLVIYKKNGGPSVSGSVLWATGTNGDSGAYAILKNDDRLWIISPSGQNLWNSVDGFITPGGSGGDTITPSSPSNLTVSGTTSSTVSLSWGASTDNVGVTGYDVFRGGAKIGTATGTTYTDSGLSASTPYTYTVKAKDAAGNMSPASNSATATTQASGGGGGTYPTTPCNGTNTSYNWTKGVNYLSTNTDGTKKVQFDFVMTSCVTGYVDVHYKINNGNQNDVRMTNVANTTNWQYTTTVPAGATVEYWFTYLKGTNPTNSVNADTPLPHYTYTAPS